MPGGDDINRIAKAKASRDVLIHNRGIVNKIYLTKAGRLARVIEGEKLAFPSEYMREVWELLQKVINDISAALLNKATADPE